MDIYIYIYISPMMRTRSTNESGGHSAYVGDFFSTVPKSMLN